MTDNAAQASTIERFEKMAQADPTNEVGHFSLGKAYLDAGQHPQAIASFKRVLELNPNIGKVYQLMATALLATNQRDEAIRQLTEGVKVAAKRGEMMPRNEMAKMLADLGAPVPATEQAGATQAVGEGQILCKRCGKVSPRLAQPPFRSDFGRLVQENTCANCWREAVGVGTKVINELRLPLDDPSAGKIWDKHIREFLNLPA